MNYEKIKQAAYMHELRKIAEGIDSSEDDMSTYYGPDNGADNWTGNGGNAFTNYMGNRPLPLSLAPGSQTGSTWEDFASQNREKQYE